MVNRVLEWIGYTFLLHNGSSQQTRSTADSKDFIGHANHRADCLHNGETNAKH